MKFIARTLARKDVEKQGFHFEQLLQKEVAKRKASLRSEIQLRLKVRKVRTRIAQCLGKAATTSVALATFLKKRRKLVMKSVKLKVRRTSRLARVRHLLPLLTRAFAKSEVDRIYRDSARAAFNQIPNGAPALETL